MANINTASAFNGRDFSYGASGYNEDPFEVLFNEVISKLAQLATTNDDVYLKMELTKLRKKMSRLVIKYFDSAVVDMNSTDTHKAYAADFKESLTKIKGKFSL